MPGRDLGGAESADPKEASGEGPGTVLGPPNGGTCSDRGVRAEVGGSGILLSATRGGPQCGAVPKPMEQPGVRLQEDMVMGELEKGPGTVEGESFWNLGDEERPPAREVAARVLRPKGVLDPQQGGGGGGRGGDEGGGGREEGPDDGGGGR